MGTRSLTVFMDDRWNDDDPEQEIVVMYRQMDGYPEGHGKDLAEFLAKGKLVNGIGMDAGVVFNGMGCLAAQVVTHFKDGPGGFYLHPAGTRDVGEEYIYIVRPTGMPNNSGNRSDGGIEIEALDTHDWEKYPADDEDDGPFRFKGSPQAFLDSLSAKSS